MLLKVGVININTEQQKRGRNKENKEGTKKGRHQ